MLRYPISYPTCLSQSSTLSTLYVSLSALVVISFSTASPVSERLHDCCKGVPCSPKLHLHHELGCARSRKPVFLCSHLPRADDSLRNAGLLESFEQPAPLRRQLQPQAGVHRHHAGAGFVKRVKLMKYPAFYVQEFVLFRTHQENVDSISFRVTMGICP